MNKREAEKRKGLLLEMHAYEAALREVTNPLVKSWLEGLIEGRRSQL